MKPVCKYRDQCVHHVVMDTLFKGTGPNSNAVFAKTLLQKRCFGNARENGFSWAVVARFIECLYNSNI